MSKSCSFPRSVRIPSDFLMNSPDQLTMQEVMYLESRLGRSVESAARIQVQDISLQSRYYTTSGGNDKLFDDSLTLREVEYLESLRESCVAEVFKVSQIRFSRFGGECLDDFYLREVEYLQSLSKSCVSAAAGVWEFDLLQFRAEWPDEFTLREVEILERGWDEFCVVSSAPGHPASTPVSHVDIGSREWFCGPDSGDRGAEEGGLSGVLPSIEGSDVHLVEGVASIDGFVGRARLDRWSIENDGLRQDNDERRLHGKRVYHLTSAWLAALVCVVLLQGFGDNIGFSLSEKVLLAVITGTTIIVVSSFKIMTGYFFRPKKVRGKTLTRKNLTRAGSPATVPRPSREGGLSRPLPL